uniref:Dolichol phosphate-mannose biosynthesis regulatory protein n=1 Tax=Culicoides sonorensis TaxID=179676 RepID=A0A336M3U2_CULSO
MASNSLTGKIIVIFCLAVFIYYIIWVSVLPFLLVDETNWIHSLFPPYQYAFLIPAIFGSCLIGGLSIYTLYNLRGLVNIF